MTGIRQSNLFALEDKGKFGSGKGSSPWIAPPPGTFVSFTHNRAASTIYTAGSKNWDEVSYGGITGSFEWTFTADYDYLWPFLLVFEDYKCVEDTSVQPVQYLHTFSKANNKRVPSFCIRQVILNRMAGGPDGSDEIRIVKGCVARNIRFSESAGSSQLNVTITGFYVDEEMQKGNLEATDYQEYDGDLMEFQCLFIGDATDANYVSNVDSLNVSIENSSDKIPHVCGPVAAEFYEGRTSFSMGMTCYSNNPSKYQQRVYSGGFDNTALSPLRKNLHPIDRVTLATYDLSKSDEEDVSECIARSEKYAMFIIDKVIIKSLTWQKGDGSKLMDQVSSCECKKLKLVIKNTIEDIKTDHQVTDVQTIE